jgi:hypothetical protein
MEFYRLQDDSKTSRPIASLQIEESWRRQVDQFEDESKISQPIEGQSRRKIESGNTICPKQFEMTKVQSIKLVFFQVESVQKISNLKFEVEENLNTIWVEAEARWVD